MSSAPAANGIAAIRRRLLRWFAAHRRDLPWRRTADPWAILVSEVMLQQTTVSAAAPYYERVLARWPRPADLARARLDELLSEWSGLGYYRRARMLHAAASAVAERGGALPGTARELAALPGVGAYTAAAVASIAFGEPVAAVDGNVERVVTRLLALPGNPREAARARAIRRAAQELLDPRRAGAFNQALMELGATVCRPTAPACGRCPLQDACLALAEGRPERYPEPQPRLAPTAVTRLAALVTRGGRVLLERRRDPPNEGFLELPSLAAPDDAAIDRGAAGARERRTSPAPPPAPVPTPSTAPAAADARRWRDRLERHLADAFGLRVRLGEALPPHRHAITRYRITVLPFAGTLSSGAVRAPLAWVSPSDPDRPLTTATRRILAAARDRLAAAPRAAP